MRWKLKDPLAEASHPVPEKAALVDCRHAKTARARASGKQQKQKKKERKREKGYDKINQMKTVKQIMSVVTARWLTRGGGAGGKAHATLLLLLLKNMSRRKHLSWLTACLMMSHFPPLLIKNSGGDGGAARGWLSTGCSPWKHWINL